MAGCATVSRTLQPLGLTSGPGYAYNVEIAGVDGELASRLEEASNLYQKKNEPPATLQGLRRRTQADRDIFLRVLHSRGFYDAAVDWHIDPKKKPARVEMRVARGERYTIATFQMDGLPPDASHFATKDGLASLGIAIGEPALAETVLDAESRLIAALAARSYPYAELPRRDIGIDRGAHAMEVRLVVDAGPKAKFGDVTVEGLKTVDENLVRQRLKFRRGDAFSPEKVEETRRALFATSVFSAVTLTWGKRADVSPGGEAPIHVLVTEGKMHSVGLGVNWSSADGPGGRAFWENRNARGGGQKLRTEFDYSEQVATGGISYRQPDWLRTDQSLLLEAKADADKPPAYKLYAVGLSAGIERYYGKRFVGTAGLLVEQSDVNSAADNDGTRNFTLLGVPLGIRYDGSDNVLDPSRGHRTLANLAPYFSVLGDTVEMVSMRVIESLYVPLDRRRRVVWATRFSFGSIVGASRSAIPADKRLYAGGGDSVRGYQYQFVGPLCDINPSTVGQREPCPNLGPPLDPADPDYSPNPKYRPRGGKSLLQAGTELRWKVTKTFGLVPFVEGAGIYDPSYPDFDQDMQWAAGLGFRYFTVAGPIRLDLGFPVNPRPSDDIFQVYISLGQAF